MKIKIFSKTNFESFMKGNYINDSNVEEQDLLIISINNPYDPIRAHNDVNSYFHRQHSNVLIMHFPDITEIANNYRIKNSIRPVFTKFMAKRMYDFIIKNKDKRMAVIHCSAGISRSGAVGLFIYDLLGRQTMSWDEFIKTNSQIVPNNFILKMLKNEIV